MARALTAAEHRQAERLADGIAASDTLPPALDTVIKAGLAQTRPAPTGWAAMAEPKATTGWRDGTGVHDNDFRA